MECKFQITGTSLTLITSSTKLGKLVRTMRCWPGISWKMGLRQVGHGFSSFFGFDNFSKFCRSFLCSTMKNHQILAKKCRLSLNPFLPHGTAAAGTRNPDYRRSTYMFVCLFVYQSCTKWAILPMLWQQSRPRWSLYLWSKLLFNKKPSLLGKKISGIFQSHQFNCSFSAPPDTKQTVYWNSIYIEKHKHNNTDGN